MNTNNVDWFANVKTRPHPWPVLNWLTRGLTVTDVKKVVDFYQNFLEMVPIFFLRQEGDFLFARMR